MLDAVNERDIQVLVVFAIGAIIGIVLFSRLLDHMITHYRSLTMAFLFGLMLGALRAPAEEIGGDIDPGSMTDIALVIIPAVLGFLMVIMIERRSREGEDELGNKASKA